VTERKSRVLAYLEEQKKKQEAASSAEDTDAPFQGIDEAFGLDEFGTEGLW
jgi:hypothetical protein